MDIVTEWTCDNCGVIFTDIGYVTIGINDNKRYYIKDGACPGCGSSNQTVHYIRRGKVWAKQAPTIHELESSQKTRDIDLTPD